MCAYLAEEWEFLEAGKDEPEAHTAKVVQDRVRFLSAFSNERTRGSVIKMPRTEQVPTISGVHIGSYDQ